MTVAFTLNGKPQTWEVRPEETLLEGLRAHGVASTKRGCGQAACGACTVWLDDAAVPACAMLCARLEGREVTTLEGVQEAAAAFGRYLVEEGADQCGYCAPGLVMLVLALKRELGTALETADIATLLCGNVCRCSGYQGWFRAVERYLKDTA